MLKKAKRERFVWTDIIITLLALEIMSYFYYGVKALAIAGICMLSSFVCEYISVKAMYKKFTADNLSCITDGLIIALMMPASINYKIPLFASVFANIVGKNIFGGRKNMIFSPAAVGYLFALTSWKAELSLYPEPFTKIGFSDEIDGLVNSTSYVFNTTGKLSISDFDILLGNFSGPMGAVSILLLLISAAILFFRKDISCGALIGALGGIILMSLMFPAVESRFDTVKYMMITNMTLFVSVFIISDIRIAPQKNYYSFYYGFFVALTSYVLLLTTGIENLLVIIAVLFTPLALALKGLESKINTISDSENELANNELVIENTPSELIEKNSDDVDSNEIAKIAEAAINEIDNMIEISSENETDIQKVGTDE